MKLNKDKLKELWKNKYTKPLLFFGFYFIFFSVILLFAYSNNNTNTDNNMNKDMWDNMNNNYEYLYEIKDADNQIVSLEGKQYGHKNLFVKKVNDIIDNEVYIFYSDVMIKEDNTWRSINDFKMVDNNFDDNYFDLGYVKQLIDDSELMDSETSFDGSKSDHYKFGNLDIGVTSENNTLKKVSIIEPLYQITMQYRNINNVKDFVVEK
jgi:hypothetical protein